MITFEELKKANIAHTDAGAFFVIEDNSIKEVEVKAKITKKRAGLFYLDIEGEQFTTHAKSDFAVGEEVIALLQYQNDFIVTSVVKL